MAQQARDEAGNIWEIDAQGNPVRLIQPASAAMPPATVQPSPWRVQQQQAEAARQAAADRRAEEASNRAARAEARADATASRGQIPAGYRMKADGSGIEPMPGFQPSGKKEGADSAAELGRMNALVRQINEVQRLFNEGPGSTKGLAGAQDFAPSLLSTSNSRFDRAANTLEDIATRAFKVPGMGAQSDADAARLAAAVKPNRWGSDAGNAQTLNDLRAQADEWFKARGLATPAWKGVVNDPRTVTGLDPSRIVREIAGANAKSIDLNDAGDAVVTYGDGSKQTVPLNDEQKNSDWYAQIYRQKRGEEPPLAVTVTDDGGTGGSSGGGNPPPGGTDRSSWQSGVDAVVRGVADVPSFGLADEAEAGLESLITGRSFSEMLRGQEAIDRADEQQNPYLRMGGQILGGIPVAVGAARLGTALTPTRPGMGALGVESGFGAAYGTGADNQDRLRGAGVGALSTVIGNQVGQRVLAPAVRGMFASRPAQALRAAVNNAKGRPTAPLPQAPTSAQSMMLRLGEDQTVDNVRGTLTEAAQLGLPMSLADANPQLRSLAGSASRLSTRVREGAEPILQGRSRGQAERAAMAAQRDFGEPVNILDARSGFKRQAQTDSDPFYKEAFARAAPVDPDISAMLDTPAGREALNRAVVIARNEGTDPNGLGFDLNDLGEVVGVRAPSFETLHMVKRGLDSVVEGARGATGVLNREDPAIAAIDNLRARFRGRLGELDENYAAGNAAYAAQMRNRDALNFGYDAIQPRVTPNILAEATSRMPVEPMRQGFRAGLFEQIDRTPFSANPYDRIVGSPERVSKVSQLFPEGAPNFLRQADLEREMAKTATEVIGGSPTAARRAADESFAPALGAQMLGETALGVATGTPPIASMTTAARNFIGDRMRLGFNGARRADEVGSILLEPNPTAGIHAIDEAAARQQAYDAWRRRYGFVGGMFGGALLPAPAVTSFAGQ